MLIRTGGRVYGEGDEWWEPWKTSGEPDKTTGRYNDEQQIPQKSTQGEQTIILLEAARLVHVHFTQTTHAERYPLLLRINSMCANQSQSVTSDSCSVCRLLLYQCNQLNTYTLVASISPEFGRTEKNNNQKKTKQFCITLITVEDLSELGCHRLKLEYKTISGNWKYFIISINAIQIFCLIK